MRSRYIFVELDPARSVQLRETARKHVKTFQYHMRTHLRGIGNSGVYIGRPSRTLETESPIDFRICWLYQGCVMEHRRWQPTRQLSLLSSHEHHRIERTRTRQRRSSIGYTGYRRTGSKCVSLSQAHSPRPSHILVLVHIVNFYLEKENES